MTEFLSNTMRICHYLNIHLFIVIGTTKKIDENVNPNERRKRKLESVVQTPKRSCPENVVITAAHVGSNKI